MTEYTIKEVSGEWVLALNNETLKTANDKTPLINFWMEKPEASILKVHCPIIGETIYKKQK